MDYNIVILSIPIYFVLIAAELIYSWFKREKYYRLGDAFANIGCGIFEQVTGIALKVFTIGIYSYVYQHWRLFDIPINAFSIFVLYLGVDFLYYWAHRMSHEINLFWIGHVVHHQSEDYNLSVALRQGALQKLFTFPFALPLAFIGFSDEWFLYISALNTVYQFWIHTEAIGKLGPLEWIFNTPSHHRVHHGRDPKYIDKNHAGSLIIWDRMFGTFQEEQERPHYGITKETGTFNPVKAHWKPIADLREDLKKVNGFDKVRLLVHSPGWFPKSAGGVQHPLKINNQTYRKFDFIISSSIGVYLFAQFLLLLSFTAFFLFTFNKLPFLDQLIYGATILFSLLIIGGLFENRKWANILEPLRIIVLFSLGFYSGESPFALAAFVLGTLSFIWFFIIKTSKKGTIVT